MKNKHIFITGANRGLGLEFTKLLLKGGYQVTASCRSLKKAKELNALAESSDQLKLVELDVSDDDSVGAFAKQVKALGPVDILLNNAGVFTDRDDMQKISMEDMLETFQTNTFGPVRMTQALLPALKKSSEPWVVNITSLMGSIADTKSGHAFAYRMSKSALNMFTKNLSVDPCGVKSVCFHPGWVQTDMGGSGATLKISESVPQMVKLIDKLKASDSGKFYNYDGNELPW